MFGNMLLDFSPHDPSSLLKYLLSFHHSGASEGTPYTILYLYLTEACLSSIFNHRPAFSCLL